VHVRDLDIEKREVLSMVAQEKFYLIDHDLRFESLQQ
jgi:hypothetical protein